MNQPRSTVATHPQSARAHERARAVMPGGNTRSTAYESPHPLYLAAGSGPFVDDLDGRRYLDLQNNFTTLIHGHCHAATRSEEHTSELQSLMRISYAVFCLKKKTTNNNPNKTTKKRT